MFQERGQICKRLDLRRDEAIVAGGDLQTVHSIFCQIWLRGSDQEEVGGAGQDADGESNDKEGVEQGPALLFLLFLDRLLDGRVDDLDLEDAVPVFIVVVLRDDNLHASVELVADLGVEGHKPGEARVNFLGRRVGPIRVPGTI